MADTQTAIAFVITLEDDKEYPGCITQLRGDKGGKTRLGVTERFHPELAEQGFFDGDPIEGETNPLKWKPTTVDDEDGMNVARDVYEKEYAEPLSLDKIASQDVSNRLLSFAVNEGPHQAVVCLQRCLPGLVVDGAIGPKTLAAINKADPGDLLKLYKGEEANFYTNLADTQPNLAQYARGLANRAAA